MTCAITTLLLATSALDALPGEDVDSAKRLAHFITQLGHEKYALREAATKELNAISSDDETLTWP